MMTKLALAGEQGRPGDWGAGADGIGRRGDQGMLGRGTRRAATSTDYGGPVAPDDAGQKTVRRSRRAGRDE